MPANSRQYQNEYIKNYVKQSPIIECECGAEIKQYNKYKHKRVSKTHYIYLNRDIEIDVNKMKADVNTLKKLLKPV